MTKVSQGLTLTGMQLLALAANASTMPQLATGDLQINAGDPAHINSVSLNAIESSWLKVSPLCKARAFNADPNPLPSETLSSEVLAFYEACS